MTARNDITRWGGAILIAIGIALASPWASAASPQLGLILPRGGQRGTNITINLHGQRLNDALALVLDDPGLSVAGITVVNANHVQATLAIAPDCRIGAHGLRVRTTSGISNLRTFSIGALPEVNETEPNNAMDAPQPIEPGCVVNGVADNEDVDYYVLDAKIGERISIEIEAMRLGDQLFDAFIALFDANGFEVASCDDSALGRQDGFISVIAPADGRYLVQVRESAYAGNGNCRYRLHVGRFARPAALLPLGGRPGQDLVVRALGPAEGAVEATVTLPAREEALRTIGGWITPGTAGALPDDGVGAAPSPNWLRITDLDNAIEAEPNNAVAQATVCAVPVALNGVIEQPGDRDCWRFTATKDQVLDFIVLARRLRTPLDSVLTIHDGSGKYLAGNDDSDGPDSAFRFTIPADGEYVLIIRDHLNEGGPAHAYRIEVEPARPKLALTAHRLVQAVAVPRGGRGGMLFTATRADFGGPLTLSAADLPPGVTMHVATVDPRVDQIPVVFEAAAEAELGHSLADLTIAHADAATGITGRYRQDVELTLGQNNVVFMAHSVDRFPVAVVEAAPFAIDVPSPKAPLVRGGSMQLRVTASRAEGFDGPINLLVPFTPPGVGASNSIAIPAGQTEAVIPINANGNAALGTWHLVIAAQADVPGGGALQVASGLVPLTIAEPFVAFAPQEASVELGQAARLFVEVTKHIEFTGSAKVELRGLPHLVTAPPMELSAEMTSLTFDVQTQSDSPPGHHKNIFCIATFDVEGEPVVHRLPAGDLRIEKPLPQAVAQAPPEPAAPAVAPPPQAETPPQERPLTRLEKLRQAHEARRKAEAKKEQEQGESQGGES